MITMESAIRYIMFFESVHAVVLGWLGLIIILMGSIVLTLVVDMDKHKNPQYYVVNFIILLTIGLIIWTAAYGINVMGYYESLTFVEMYGSINVA